MKKAFRNYDVFCVIASGAKQAHNGIASSKTLRNDSLPMTLYISAIFVLALFLQPLFSFAQEPAAISSPAQEILDQLSEVHVDDEKGDWSRGLVAYLLEHLKEEREGKGWLYRKQILIDYESYVSPDNEFPLKEFRQQKDRASRAIGYGKSVMFFHMLKRLAGDDIFYKSLRNFIEANRLKKASWDDIRIAFEKESGRKLDRFFDQWLNEKGFTAIEVKDIKVERRGIGSLISFDVVQSGKMFAFELPVTIKTDRGETREVLKIEKEQEGFEIATEGNPDEMIIDEAYDVFRKLSKEELPPVIAKIMNDEKGILILPAEAENEPDEPTYSDIVKFFEEKGYSAKKPEEIKDEDLRKSAALILGFENPIAKRLFGKKDKTPHGLVISAKKNPFNPAKVIAVADASSDYQIRLSLRKLSDYDKFSLVSFIGGENTEKRIDENQRGWIMPLKEDVIGIEPARTVNLSDIANKVSGKKIIYIGEQHTRYEHHLAQLELIKESFGKNPMMAVGMEMFPVQSQEALDDYIEGRIEEKEFLKASGYFKNWGFDYNLYKDILRFARDEGIPAIALNIKKEIVDKVARSGIDSLTEEEKRELPDGMDMTDEEYRQRLKEVFENHIGSSGRIFDNFYQSQIIWDETMAQAIDEYLKKNPDRQLIAIVGGGHLAFNSGIPKRAFRRNGMDYAVIINDESVEKGIADFVLFPKPSTMPSSPKLMVILKEENGRVIITGFTEGSISEKAGMKVDDVIVSLDGEKISDVEDVKIFLFYKKPGDTVSVTVLRKGFFSGEKETRFKVTLPSSSGNP